MKFRKGLSLMLAMLLLSGCSMARMGNDLEAAGDAIEERMDAAANAMENSVNTSSTQMTPGTAGALTKEQAQTIALEHAGFTADQVRGLRTEYEIDDGVPRFEVQFHQGRWEYDYEINAQTGEILSYDRDD